MGFDGYLLALRNVLAERAKSCQVMGMNGQFVDGDIVGRIHGVCPA